MDRLGRTKVEVFHRIYDRQEKGIQIRTLNRFINIRGLGKFAHVLIGFLSGFAEVERSLTG